MTTINDNDLRQYVGKTQEEVILLLEQQTVSQERVLQELRARLNATENENEALAKLSGQVSITKTLFFGICLLLLATLGTAIVSWNSVTASASIEKITALSERVCLVLCGVLSSSCTGIFGQLRNGGNGG